MLSSFCPPRNLFRFQEVGHFAVHTPDLEEPVRFLEPLVEVARESRQFRADLCRVEVLAFLDVALLAPRSRVHCEDVQEPP